MIAFPKIFRHIRTRLVVIYFTLSATTFVVLGVSFYYTLRESLDEEMGLRLVMVARIAAEQLDPSTVRGMRPGDEDSRIYKDQVRTLRSLLKIGAASRIYVFGREQRSLADTREEVSIGTRYFRLASSGAEIREAFSGKAADSTVFKGLDGLYYKSAFAPVFFDKQVVAVVGVDAGVTFFEALTRLKRDFLFFCLGASILIVAVSFLLALGFERPIARLAQSAQRLAEGDLKTEIVATTADEIGFLAETLNTARKRIVERDTHLQMLQRGIAHEVRNPLGGMKLFCDILAEELAGQPEKMAHLEKIQRELTGLENVVNEFLDYTRELPIIPRAVGLSDFLREILEAYRGSMEKGIRISLDVATKAQKAHFDPGLIRRAIYNLVNNAVQAMPDGGELRIEVDRERGDLVIRIIDSGAGILPEEMEHLFEPFFTTKDKGTGLGMPFAKKIVEKHGGRISITSRRGEGTRVEIRLPDKKEA